MARDWRRCRSGQAFAISSLQTLGRLRLQDSPVQDQGMAHGRCGELKGKIMRRAEKVQNREQTDDPDETSERPIDQRI